MIRVHMGLDQPLQLEAVFLDEGDDLVGMIIGDAAGGVVDVHHAVDDGAGIAVRILDHIADRVRCRVEEGRDVGFDRHVDRIICSTHSGLPRAL